LTGPDNFCDIFRQEYQGCVMLEADKNGLVHKQTRLPAGMLQPLLNLDTASASLEEVLQRRKLDGARQLKLLLSYLLAKAIWESFDTDWMLQRWTKDAIRFLRQLRDPALREEESIASIHRPYFMADLRSYIPKNTTLGAAETAQGQKPGFYEDLYSTHEEPKILALGVLLLEIQLGHSIDIYRTKSSYSADGTVKKNDDHWTAGRIIHSDKWKNWDTYEAVKEIIKACVSPDSKLVDQPETVREKLYKDIVAPLGRLFREA
jgi:hypothetical protein